MEQTKRKITGFSEAGFPIYEDEVVEPYLKLAAAIVRQANKDYSNVYGKMLRARNTDAIRKLQPEKDELEDFYHSDWFDTLTNIDPDRLIKLLRKKEIRKEKARLEKKYKV